MRSSGVDDAFVSLETLLCGREQVTSRAAPTEDIPPPAMPIGEAARELGLLRLAARDAYDRAARALLQSLAGEVLGRELKLAPPDIDALTKRALDVFATYEPLALIVSADDARRIGSPIPIRIDPSMGVGDFSVEVRTGAFESLLAFRRDEVIARAIAAA